MYSKVKSGISTEDLNNIVAQKEKKDNELADELISIIKSKIKYYKDLVISTIKTHEFQTDLIKQLKDAAYKGQKYCNIKIIKIDENDIFLNFIKKETKGYISNDVEYEKYSKSVTYIALKKLYYKDFDNFRVTDDNIITKYNISDKSYYFIANNDDDKKHIRLGHYSSDHKNIFDLTLANFLARRELDVTDISKVLKEENINIYFTIMDSGWFDISLQFSW